MAAVIEIDDQNRAKFLAMMNLCFHPILYKSTDVKHACLQFYSHIEML